MIAYFPQLLQGAWVTIQVACAALVLGLLLGLLSAFAEMSHYKWLTYPVKLVTTLLRGLPELLVIFMVYYGGTYVLTWLFGGYVEVNAFMAGVTALGLIFGSYSSQVLRGAFQSIPIGQQEVARVMGMRYHQIIWCITLPQAWRHALPGLGNLWLVLLKDTALISLIGLADLMNRAHLAASNTNYYFKFYLLAAGIYLLLTFLSEVLIRWLVHKANVHMEKAG